MADDKTQDLTDWLTTTEAARVLECSGALVLQFHERGLLADVHVTHLGRLFNPEEVEFLRQQRAQEKAGRV